MENIFDDFPIDALPPIARQAVESLAGMTQAYCAMFAPSLLGVAGYIAAKRVYCSTSRQGDPCGSNGYFMTVAPSASGKDSAAKLWKPLLDYEAERRKRWRERERPEFLAALALLESDERLMMEYAKKRKLDPNEKETLIDIKFQIAECKDKLREKYTCLMDDYTEAALMRNLESSGGRIMIASEEARSFVKNLMGEGFSKSTGEGPLLKMYSGSQFKPSRAGVDDDKIIDEARASVAVLMQPDVAQQIFESPAMMVSGLWGRFCYCIVPKKSRRHAGFSKGSATGLEEFQDWARQLMGDFENERIPFKIQLTKGAEAVWAEFYDYIECSDDAGKLAGYENISGRWAENALRIAIQLHVLENAERAGAFDIDANTMKSALRVQKWFVSQTMQHMGKSADESKTTRREKVYAGLRKHKNGLSIKKLLSGGFATNSREAGQVLEQMKAEGLVTRRVELAGNGREVSVWSLVRKPRLSHQKSPGVLAAAA